jgi:uncharacterized membrane protein
MKKIVLLSLVFVASCCVAQDAATAIQVPPKPTCVVILRNGSCADLWRQYNTALLQQYVARQKEAASAPLQQQITDLNRLVTEQQAQIKTMQEQAQADNAAAVQAKADASKEGMLYGFFGALFLVGIIFAVKKVMQGYSVTKKPQAKAASA